MGLRHQDAFGPIGFGLSATPRSDTKPPFGGPIAAFETFDHLLSSPTSVGSDRFNDPTTFFSARLAAMRSAATTAETCSSAESGPIA
jgi:hypothetical protein